MEEIKYERKERGIGHVGDGESTQRDLVSMFFKCNYAWINMYA